ncbi:hypothetical protein IFO70_37535 [Phormidium tenue FACHB-886]|nr:hypothetical protein [Phormidium tenue FACHB-886]
MHKEDYNNTVQGMRDDVTSVQEISEETIAEAEATIAALENRIDTLKGQLSKIQDYISFNYGKDKWQAIKKMFNVK